MIVYKNGQTYPTVGRFLTIAGCSVQRTPLNKSYVVSLFVRCPPSHHSAMYEEEFINSRMTGSAWAKLGKLNTSDKIIKAWLLWKAEEHDA